MSMNGMTRLECTKRYSLGRLMIQSHRTTASKRSKRRASESEKRRSSVWVTHGYKILGLVRGSSTGEVKDTYHKSILE
jgi:hypothetical protein